MPFRISIWNVLLPVADGRIGNSTARRRQSALGRLPRGATEAGYRHAMARMEGYRPTPRAPDNQNAEVSHNTIRMANSTPPAMRSAQLWRET
jgi:hypothetical protein